MLGVLAGRREALSEIGTWLATEPDPNAKREDMRPIACRMKQTFTPEEKELARQIVVAMQGGEDASIAQQVGDKGDVDVAEPAGHKTGLANLKKIPRHSGATTTPTTAFPWRFRLGPRTCLTVGV